ncbi:2-dehydropantoate 2-reductase N-terminal domain-containing protein [Tsukamurella soli]|uniref:2-dehydropantoate 2-reductase N-terminal domain-containing protein n=1 Tax=Tsukamurella soli TaxID=644556 RepID=A0ABP8JGX6_9ACTN
MDGVTNRYVIIGAGAIGGGIGGLLTRSGVPTVLVARGAHLDRMRADGLRIRTPDTDETTAVTVAGSPADVELTDSDVLVFTTKTHQVEAALAEWADAPVGDRTAGEALPALIALNGVAADRRALRWFSRVYGVCVWMPAVYLTPGEVIVRAAPVHGILHTSRVPAEATDDADRALLARIAADWAPAGLEVPLPDDVMPWKYRKLLSNLGNAVQALLGTMDREIAEAARSEAQRIYAAAAITMNSEADEQRSRERLQVRPVPGASPDALGGSTWQSMKRRAGSSEADFLNGEIASIAHGLGMRAPVNAGLARLMRQASRAGTEPGASTADQLRAALE